MNGCMDEWLNDAWLLLILEQMFNQEILRPGFSIAFRIEACPQNDLWFLVSALSNFFSSQFPNKLTLEWLYGWMIVWFLTIWFLTSDLLPSALLIFLISYLLNFLPTQPRTAHPPPGQAAQAKSKWHVAESFRENNVRINWMYHTEFTRRHTRFVSFLIPNFINFIFMFFSLERKEPKVQDLASQLKLLRQGRLQIIF